MSAIRIAPKSLLILLLCLFCIGCHPRSHKLEPHISYIPQKRQFQQNTSDFKNLTPEEQDSAWGKELNFGQAFAKDFDFYRAITCLKRSLFAMPEDLTERRMQAEFLIIQCYYLGQKYPEALEIFEFGTIRKATSTFPAFRDLLVILYDSYEKTDQFDKAETVMRILEKGDPETALDLKLTTSIEHGHLDTLFSLSEKHPRRSEFTQFLSETHHHSKSVAKAQFLNAILPGAGYLYVGQKKTALTSLILNTSFIAATTYFFNQGNWGAGLFTASLEIGWYFGGINGAGLAAKEYNECLYSERGKDLMIKNTLFPVLMLQTGF